jgi:hypothetical protein
VVHVWARAASLPLYAAAAFAFAVCCAVAALFCAAVTVALSLLTWLLSEETWPVSEEAWPFSEATWPFRADTWLLAAFSALVFCPSRVARPPAAEPQYATGGRLAPCGQCGEPTARTGVLTGTAIHLRDRGAWPCGRGRSSGAGCGLQR